MKGLKILPIVLAAAMLASCKSVSTSSVQYVEPVTMSDISVIGDEMAALADAPNAPESIEMPVASGTEVKENDQAVIDYSNTADGYVMVKYKASSENKLKAQVVRETTYTYDLPAGDWVTFPLSDGNGEYKITVFENIEGNKYSTVLSEAVNVTLNDEFAPFLRPNQYVNYENTPNVLAKAEELTADAPNVLEKVAKIYDFVVNNLEYDKAKAKTIQSGYLPELEDVLAEKKGVCFDYASLMTAMLRSQGVPCKLVVGYVNSVCHAWISVWSEETGWIDGAVYFDGTVWQRMDPTFISSGKGSESVREFVGDGNNYTPKYLY